MCLSLLDIVKMFVEKIEYCDEIYLTDVKFHGYKRSGAVYIVNAERKAIIETGPSLGVGNVFDALNELKIAREEVEYIMPTHIHLDHAGATGYLAEWCENASIVCHEAGVDYLSIPEKIEKLLSSVRSAVGDHAPDYGSVTPTARERFEVVSGGETIDLGDRKLEVLHAPGHAPHQIVFYESENEAFFTGDEAGMWIENELRPTTPPPSFDFDRIIQSLELMKSYEPKLLLYTHFGPRRNATDALDEYRDFLKKWVSSIKESWQESEDREVVKEKFAKNKSNQITIWDESTAEQKLKTDVEGVLQYLEKKHSKQKD